MLCLRCSSLVSAHRTGAVGTPADARERRLPPSRRC